MKLNNINFSNFSTNNNLNGYNPEPKSDNSKSEANVANISSYPKNYYVSFGARPIEEIDLNIMPSTVLAYVVENADKNEDKTLREIQQSVFKELKNCHSVEEIQEHFPDEDYFINIPKENNANKMQRYVYVDSEGNLCDEGKGTKESIQAFIIREVFLNCKKYQDVGAEVNSFIGGNSPYECAEKVKRHYGIVIPDGRRYGQTLRAGMGDIVKKMSEVTKQKISDSNKKHWEELSQDEKTERITQLQMGSQKERIIMINAWNKIFNLNIPIREDLSKFICVNMSSFKAEEEMNFEKLTDSIQGSGDRNLNNSAMSKLMTAFWKQYPEYANILGEQIEISAKEYKDNYEDGNNNEYISGIFDEQARISAKFKQWKKEQPLSQSDVQSKLQKELGNYFKKYISGELK